MVMGTRRFLLFFAMANLLEVIDSQTTRPLCYTQVSAANQACAALSEVFSHSLVPTNASRTNVSRHDDVPDDDGDDGGNDDGGSDDGGDDDHGGDDNHGGDDDNHGDDDHHHHKRRRKHKKGKKRHHEWSTNKECCRWLKEVDNDCVCEVLLRLPSFLVKPKHKYMVRVGRTCRLSYNCQGTIPIPRRRRRRH